MPTFAEYCDGLLATLRGAHWKVIAEKQIPYGRQYELADQGGAKGNLNCYHGKKGFKWVTGGKHGDDLAEALGRSTGSEQAAKAALGPSDDPFKLGLPRIGGDESGKGDFFGPLVVAAFATDVQTAIQLAELGVADSKSLSDPVILRLAGKLEALGRGNVIRLMPRDYNPRYAGIRNLNVLLAQMHAECVNGLLAQVEPPGVVLIDQFVRNDSVLKKGLELPQGCRLVTRTRAEADPAVAAASILARAGFVDGLRELSTEFGMDLPPGAGSPVLKAGREFKRSFGGAALEKVAKVHFATVKKL